MADTTGAGTRIRERRIQRGLRQAELAAAVGISPSYLNLIEHNRRRIGGKLLIRIAEQLQVETVFLSEGVQGVIIASLTEAGTSASLAPVQPPEMDRVDEFAGRFPGWAELVAAQSREIASLRHAVEVLNDRLSHDPFLSAALHEVISSVSSIRSSSSILVDSPDLEREWRDRFQRNIHEDSARLVEASQSLVAYLDQDVETTVSQATPQEELAEFLARADYAPSADTPPVQISEAGGDLVAEYLAQAATDRAHLPESTLAEALRQSDDPVVLASLLSVPLPVLFRRLAFRPVAPGATNFGYVCVDGAGALLLKKPIDGFQLPSLGGACPLWPVFAALSQPMVPLRMEIAQHGADRTGLMAYAVAAPVGAGGLDAAPRFQAHMLLRPTKVAAPRKVGVNCRICPARDCGARRERAIVSDSY